MNIWNLGWSIIGIGSALLTYYVVLKPKMAEAAKALGKSDAVAAAPNIVAKAWAMLDGWRTIVFSAVGVAVQFITPTAIAEFQALPWGSIIDQKTANTISFVCLLATWAAHAVGYAKAARTPPQS